MTKRQNGGCAGSERGDRRVPLDLEEAEFESIAALGADAEVGKDKETGIFTVIFRVLEMIETRDNRSSSAAGLAIL